MVNKIIIVTISYKAFLCINTLFFRFRMGSAHIYAEASGETLWPVSP